jgi:hypothetical protein
MGGVLRSYALPARNPSNLPLMFAYISGKSWLTRAATRNSLRMNP